MIDYVFTILWVVLTIGAVVLAYEVRNYFVVLLPFSCLAGLAASFYHGATIYESLLVQAVAAIVAYLLFLIPYKVASKLNHNKMKKGKTNLKALIGERCLVVEDISNINVKGLVNVKGSIWSARSVDQNDYIEQGTIVVVTNIEGCKLVCKREK
jgi:membrane protein implicated in regulation of membrane protease activity